MTEQRATLGVVLAGGQSRRMGQDKADLMLDGRSLLQRAVDLLQSMGLNAVVVSGEREGYRCVADVQPGGGPLVGLVSVMRQYPGERMLVLPVDMPLLDAEILHSLLAAEPEANAVHFDEAVLPIRIDSNPTVIAAAAAQLAHSDASRHSLRSLLSRVDAHSLPHTAYRDRLQSCNTPEQWQAMLP